ncbi:hypothetical protein CROQUDRAFT_723679 [Cronartium quercuum f. sp. fusiforme G11]|uniref:DNA polymerase eta n=1 Tax=Cronartium quercuum f. sp. fusiforme G11 TaxID=708437 RepID=A0A9P6NK46_9BASI|nr:hypothetical protein CROQUDRAFT_723679 [Cronartium quercuum f. sp. fusiforme G11]
MENLQQEISTSITYRQLYSKTIGPQHPLRVIAHLIAVNYPAREFGITRFLDIDQAKKLCPDSICVHVSTYQKNKDINLIFPNYHENPIPDTHKVSLDPYRRESLKILKIFKLHCEFIEKASIDEAFLDFSIQVRDLILKRYPELKIKDESNINLDDQLPLPSKLEHKNQLKLSNDFIQFDHNQEEEEEEEEEEISWSDLALSIGAELMENCRKDIFNQLGYTCSAGIANNKLLAKLCSSYKKPNAQTILKKSSIKNFLRPLEITKLRFLGGKLGQSVLDLIPTTEEEKRIGSIWKISLIDLQMKTGDENGLWVWERVRGIDNSLVLEKVDVKSMMSSKNFRPFINSWDQVDDWLKILSTDLLARLNEAREINPGLWPKTMVIHKRDENQKTISKQINFIHTNNLSREYIYNLSKRLLTEFSKSLGTLSGLCLSLSGLIGLENGQRDLDSFFNFKGLKDEDDHSKSLSKKRKVDDDDDDELVGYDSPSDRLSYKCPRCGEVLKSELSDGDGDQDKMDRMERLKVEHADHHFAKDLWDQDGLIVKNDQHERLMGGRTGEGGSGSRSSRSSRSSGSHGKKKLSKTKLNSKKGSITAFFKPVNGEGGSGHKKSTD